MPADYVHPKFSRLETASSLFLYPCNNTLGPIYTYSLDVFRELVEKTYSRWYDSHVCPLAMSHRHNQFHPSQCRMTKNPRHQAHSLDGDPGSDKNSILHHFFEDLSSRITCSFLASLLSSQVSELFRDTNPEMGRLNRRLALKLSRFESN